MDFKILVLKFKNEIIESINNLHREDRLYVGELLQGKSIDQLLEIEQNTNNDRLEPFPKNFDIIKIDLCGIRFHDVGYLKYISIPVIDKLIPDDYIYGPIIDNICWRKKNIGGIYKCLWSHGRDCVYDIEEYGGNTITVAETEVCDFFVSRIPCLVCIGNTLLTELQKSYNVIPIKQFNYIYYLKPTGLLTKAAIKK